MNELSDLKVMQEKEHNITHKILGADNEDKERKVVNWLFSIVGPKRKSSM